MRLLFLMFVALFHSKTVFAERQYKKISIYIAAHQDDWQLFMGNKVYDDINDSTCKVTIIHITAGDASCGIPVNKNYYKAREKGAINALEFCADYNSIHKPGIFDTIAVNGHNIRRFTYKNIENYFLMIPDGCLAGGSNGQSLEFLKKGMIPALKTVDSSSIYSDWGDLVKTLKEIILTEKGTITHTLLNIPDIDPKYNPNDHPDHIYSSLASVESTMDIKSISYRLYTDYHISELPTNLKKRDIVIKGALYALYDFGLTQNQIGSNWSSHQEYLDRCYFRILNSKPDRLIYAFLGIGNGRKVKEYNKPGQKTIEINYVTMYDESVKIEIKDKSGKKVMNISDDRKPAGYYMLSTDISKLACGIYYAEVTIGKYHERIKFQRG